MTRPPPALPIHTGLSSSGRAPQPVHGFLGRDSTCASLPCKYSQRLQNSVSRLSETSVSKPFSRSTFFPRENDSYRRGGLVHAAQRSHTGSDGAFPFFCFEHFYSPQKRWGQSPSDQSKAFKQQISFSPTFQNGYGERCRRSPPTRRFRSVDRPQGRLLSHSSSSVFTKISPLHLEREAIRVSGSPIRPQHGSIHLYESDSPSGRVPPCAGDSPDFLSGRYSHSGADLPRMPPECGKGRFSSADGRLSDKLEKVFSGADTEFSFSRPVVGHHFGNNQFGREETVFSPISSISPSFSDVSELPFSDENVGPHDGRDPSGPLDPPPLSSSPDLPQQILQNMFGSSSPSLSHSGSFDGVDLGENSYPIAVPSTDLGSQVRGCGPTSGFRRLRPRLGSLFRGSDGERDLGCSCPSPYQCEGDHSSVNLPAGLLSVHSSSRKDYSLGDRLYDSVGLHRQGRGDSLSPSSQGCPRDIISRQGSQSFDSPCLCSVRGESPCGLCLKIQESAGLASSTVDFQKNLRTLGNADDRSLCVTKVDSTSPLHGLGKHPISGSLRCSVSPMDIRHSLSISSSPSDLEGGGKDCSFVGPVHSSLPLLAGSSVASEAAKSPSVGRSSPAFSEQSGGRSCFRKSTPASPVPPSRRLEDFRRAHKLEGVSTESFQLISSGWRQSSNDRYDRAWRSFSDFLRSNNVSIDSVSVNDVVDYLSLLFRRGLKYSTINLHRSAISMTLPLVDGVHFGQHPLIVRLMKGVHNQRPPSRRLFPSWDASLVVQLFRSWPSPPPLHLQIRKTAFLLAMASTRRPSELASLKVSKSFLSINSTSARFVPSQLSKTDKANRMGKPISIYRLVEDQFLCPVSNVELLMGMRSTTISHDLLFFEDRAPFGPLSTAAFSRRISWVLRQAGINAPPGSTRAMSTSAAFLKGFDLDAILRAGNWAGAEVFFRFYCRDLGVNPQAPSSSDQ